MDKRGEFNSSQVANFFIERALHEKVGVTMLKLIKLTYIAHGWHLALADEPLLEEPIQAWKYGPVLPSLYHTLKHCGKAEITRLLSEYDFGSGNLSVPKISESKYLTVNVLEKVWDVYKYATGESLIEKTHEAGSPWSEVFDNDTLGLVIPNQSIKDYYRNLLGTYIS